MRLYSFHRSSSAFRVRIALHLKGVAFEYVPVRLGGAGGEQHSDAYRALNPQGLVPLLVDGAEDGRGSERQRAGDPPGRRLAIDPASLIDGSRDVVVRQSLAIIEYLDEVHPATPLLPRDSAGRARVRAIAQHIACEIQPLNNLRVDRFLTEEAHLDAEVMLRWRRRWISEGFDTLERDLAGSAATGTFCHGDAPTMADCCLVPQVFNAHRENVRLDVAAWPTLARIFAACMALPAFEAARPERQPDAG